MSGRRVLLVEDDLRVREVLAAYLAVDGWAVTEAVDGEDGLRAARQSTPDLVVTDVMMPRLCGTEMVLALREDELLRRIPVLVISGHPEPEIDYGEGAPVAFISKPVTLGSFLRAVRELLSASA